MQGSFLDKKYFFTLKYNILLENIEGITRYAY
jgi:hypothetical protein